MTVQMLCARCGFETPMKARLGMKDPLARDSARSPFGWVRLLHFRVIKGTTATSEDVEELRSTALGRFLHVEVEDPVNF